MINDFLDGITSYGAALRHLSKHRMWGFAMIPGIISLLPGIAVFGTAWVLSGSIGNVLDDLWPWDRGREVVGNVARVFGGLLVLLFGLLVFKQLVMVVTAPFLSILSERVELQMKGDNKVTSLSFNQIISDVWRGLRIAARNLVRELFLTVILLIVGLFPFFTPFTTLAIFLLQAYYAGFGNMDFALERHFSYQDSVRFVHRNRGLALGNGVVFLVLLFTFAGFLFALPLSTVASTMETVKRLNNRNS